MPRQKRLDIIGCLYHVIGRGIERCKYDRIEFLRRLSTALESTNTLCYSWVLMDNHYHLLLRPLSNNLSLVMRKLLSGYVGYFNTKHRRIGHLFQNRYKSILCQDDIYLKELIRYIHLNPVRAGIVKNLSELKKYPWSGHSYILGERNNTWQETEEVLCYFGYKKREAKTRYLNFIRDGWDMGHRKNLVGGGLLRSAGGMRGIIELRKDKIKWQSDSRILGDGDFVKTCLEQTDIKEEIKMRLNNKYTLDSLGSVVCKELKVDEKDLFSGRRLRSLNESKGVYAFLAIEYLRASLKDVGNKLKMSSTNSVYKVKEKGRKYIEENGNFLISE